MKEVRVLVLPTPQEKNREGEWGGEGSNGGWLFKYSATGTTQTFSHLSCNLVTRKSTVRVRLEATEQHVMPCVKEI